MALVIALALMTGLQQELRNRILGSNAHVYVWKQGGIADYREEVHKLLTVPHVIGAAPEIHGLGIIQAAAGAEQPIQLKGVDPALEGRVTNIVAALRRGSLETLSTPVDDHEDGILLGKDLATSLGVSVGDSVSVVTSRGVLSPMGLLHPARPLRVAGIFDLGLYEFDSMFGFVSLDTARRLLSRDVDDIQLRIDDIFASSQVARSIPTLLGRSYMANDWTELNRPLFSALWLEKLAMSITIGLIVMVAALNIVASLVLLVMEKNRDIAILKTMGASARSIMTIFMLEGLIIGLVGTAAGAAAGFGASRVLDHYRLIRIPSDVYQVSYVPFTVLPRDFAVVLIMAILVCFLATIYPSRQAARLDPAEALRYE